MDLCGLQFVEYKFGKKNRDMRSFFIKTFRRSKESNPGSFSHKQTLLTTTATTIIAYVGSKECPVVIVFDHLSSILGYSVSTLDCSGSSSGSSSGHPLPLEVPNCKRVCSLDFFFSRFRKQERFG